MVALPTAELLLEPDDRAPARARLAVVQAAGGDADLERRLKLLTTELVTNSVRHAGLGPDDRIRLRVVCDGGQVLVEVRDPGRGDRVPAVSSRDPMAAEGGLGLHLVDQLADDWGAGPVPGEGVRAWFVVREPLAPVPARM